MGRINVVLIAVAALTLMCLIGASSQTPRSSTITPQADKQCACSLDHFRGINE